MIKYFHTPGELSHLPTSRLELQPSWHRISCGLGGINIHRYFMNIDDGFDILSFDILYFHPPILYTIQNTYIIKSMGIDFIHLYNHFISILLIISI